MKLSVDQALARAKRLARNGEVLEAEKLFGEIVNAYPKNLRARQALAALRGSGSSAVPSLPPEVGAKIANLAKLYHQGRLKELSEQARPLVDQHPRAIPLWMLLGASYIGQGLSERALACFRSVLKIEPRHAEAHNNLGAAFQALGDLDSAIESYSRAVDLKPDHGEAHFNLGNTLARKREYAEAITSFGRSLSFKPDYAEAHNNLGSALKELGELDRAVESYRRALEYKLDYADAHNNLGNALKATGELALSIEHYRSALKGQRNLAEIHTNLGSALREEGNLAMAIDHYGLALSIKPDHVTAHGNLGNALQEKGDLATAIRCYRQALLITPGETEWYGSIGNTEKERGHVAEAYSQYCRARALNPSNMEYSYLAGLLLPKIAVSCEDIGNWRHQFEAGIVHLTGLPHRLEDPGTRIPAVAFDLAYHDRDDQGLMQALSRLYRGKASGLNFVSPHISTWDGPKGDRIKLGICSQYLATHTIGKLYKGLIENIDHTRFQVTLLHASKSSYDSVSANLDTHVDKAMILPSALSAKQETIAREELDVLFYPDIGMAPATYFLSHARLAPVQVVGWGHPDSTGIDTVDYFISAATIEPDDGDAHYTERLIRFSRLPSCYEPLLVPDQVPDRATLGLPEVGTLYGCPQSLFKFHPDFDPVLAKIAEGDPTGHIVVIDGKQPAWTALLQERWAASFPVLNERVLFVPRQNLDGFMKMMSHFDVLLDPIHFGSGNTMYESQVFGTPTVTWPGRFMRGRIVAGAYQQMGVSNAPIANSIGEYASVALRFGKDPTLREVARREFLEASANRLFSDRGVIHEYEEFFLAAVRAAGSRETLTNGWMPGH